MNKESKVNLKLKDQL